MNLRKAKKNDIPQIMQIINDAKEYFKKSGINQWQQGYPDENTITDDIENGRGYVFCDGEKVCATAAYCPGVEPDYLKIYNGEWKSSSPYAAIHRIAVSEHLKGQGIAKQFMFEMFKLCIRDNFNSVRIDTHENNISMQRMLAKCGFEYCGIIYLRQNGDARNAYELILSDPQLQQ